MTSVTRYTLSLISPPSSRFRPGGLMRRYSRNAPARTTEIACGHRRAGRPPLPYEPWRATLDTLHAHAQVLGKLAAPPSRRRSPTTATPLCG